MSAWNPPEVEVLYDEDLKVRSDILAPQDFTCLNYSSIPVFSENAVTVLEELLFVGGELLPLIFNTVPYFAFNVTRVIDALNQEQSEVTRFSDGSIMQVKQFVFAADRVRGVDVFKIPEQIRSTFFVSQRFVDLVKAHSLMGFKFHLCRCDPPPE
jgi:hypothetical protein